MCRKAFENIAMTVPVLAALDRLRFASDLVFTRAGDAVLATIRNATSDAGQPNPSRIWRFDAEGARPLTDGPNGDALAKPSPCGESIAFISDRACRGKQALYLLESDARVRSLGDIPGSVEDLCWSKDGASIVVLAADRGLSGGAIHAATRIWWGSAEEPELSSCAGARRRLFRVWLADERTEEVGPLEQSVWEFALVPGGALVVASPDASERGWHHAQLLRIHFDDRSEMRLYASAWQLQGLAVDPAGCRVAFLEGWSSDRGLVAGEIRLLDLASGQVSLLASEQQSNVTSLCWRDQDSLWFTAWERLGTAYGMVTADGLLVWQRHEDASLGESSFLAKITLSEDGLRMAAVRESVGEPPEIVWKHSAQDEWERISELNEDVRRMFPSYPEVRRIAWHGRDGLPLESLVLLPRKNEPGPLPLIVDIHGGPCYAVKYSFNPGNALAYAAAGFAVFLPNYRGNVGWGQSFTRMNLGDPAGAEFDDILAGVDHCIALGLADPQRLGVTGSSYGGYLTNWAVATSARFKAAVSVSSISHQLSCHYSCEHDFHAFINGGPLTTESSFQLALERSPLMQMRSASTPTLLIHGREDRCTPVSEAQQFYAALRERGVAAELAVYPREGHGGFRERAHRIDGWERRIAWFEQYLNGEK